MRFIIVTGLLSLFHLITVSGYSQTKKGEVFIKKSCVISGYQGDMVYKLSDTTFITFGWDDNCNGQLICYNNKLERQYILHETNVNSYFYVPRFVVRDNILVVLNQIEHEDKSSSVVAITHKANTGEKIGEHTLIKLDKGKVRFLPRFSDDGRYILLRRLDVKKGEENHYVQIFDQSFNKVAEYNFSHDASWEEIELKVENNGDIVNLLKPNDRSFVLNIYTKNGTKKAFTYTDLDMDKKESFFGGLVKRIDNKYLLVTHRCIKDQYVIDTRLIWCNLENATTLVFKSDELNDTNKKCVMNDYIKVWRPRYKGKLNEWILKGKFEIYDCLIDEEGSLYIVSEDYEEIGEKKVTAIHTTTTRGTTVMNNTEYRESNATKIKYSVGTLVVSKFNGNGDYLWTSIFPKSAISDKPNAFMGKEKISTLVKSDYLLGKKGLNFFSLVPVGKGPTNLGNWGVVYNMDKNTGRINKPHLLIITPSFFDAALTEWITPNNLILMHKNKKGKGAFSPINFYLSSYEFKSDNLINEE